MALSERFKAWRVSEGLTQVQAGEKIGVKQSAISDWESGRAEPDLASLRKIVDATGLTADELLDASPPAAARPPKRRGSAPGRAVG